MTHTVALTDGIAGAAGVGVAVGGGGGGGGEETVGFVLQRSVEGSQHPEVQASLFAPLPSGRPQYELGPPTPFPRQNVPREFPSDEPTHVWYDGSQFLSRQLY